MTQTAAPRRPTVLITAAKLAPEAVALLEEAGLAPVYTAAYPERDALVAAVREHRPVALLHRQGLIDGAVLDAAAPHLRVVARHGAGVDGIDVPAAEARGITVARAAGANSRAVAEHSMALLLALLKDLPAVSAGMREGLWEKATRVTRDAEGLALGIVGYGAIGSKVARFAGAFGVRVMAYDPYLPGDGLPGPGERVADLPSLLARSEALSLHCPLSDETRGMIGAAQFASLPKGALLVNAARGGIVDEAALLEAIEAGRIAAAGIDVFATEPLPADSPLRRHPRVLASPHLAASSVRGGVAMATGAAECIVAVLAGRLPALPGAIVVPGGLRAAVEGTHAAA
ncbi:hydroxyacid dehydrogenase [Craurococcus roseus]|uniref:Hydroxyacid dehydrogenase n=1 Tax=Craurococcus roseus TaxID=77585 RepID=A0ABN1G964_9PROT